MTDQDMRNAVTELEIGDVVVLTKNGGELIATVTSFVHDGNAAILTPNNAAVRRWFPNGYQLGKAHWPSMLKRV